MGETLRRRASGKLMIGGPASENFSNRARDLEFKVVSGEVSDVEADSRLDKATDMGDLIDGSLIDFPPGDKSARHLLRNELSAAGRSVSTSPETPASRRR